MLGNYVLPEMEDFVSGRVKTLGWGVLDWCSTYLGQPDGENKGDRWKFTREQALFILRWYAVNENGGFIFNRRAVLERPKGWGKSPLLAAMCCAELLGPVRFSHWGDDGEPVGKPVASPLIQIAAISDDQADNTYSLVMEMLLEGDAYRAYGFDKMADGILLSRVRAPNGGLIKKVTASPRGREGQRVTFVVCDETHLWVPAEKGPELYDALRRNAVKMKNRIVETTNAPVPGEGSVAEQSYNSVVSLAAECDTYEDVGILLDTRQVVVDDIYNREKAFPALKFVYGDAHWIDLESIWADITDPSTREHVARRFYFNQKVEGFSTWINQAQLQATFDPNLKLLPNQKFAIGFSGNIARSAALVACRLEDGALFLLGLWERPDRDDTPDDWEVPFVEVDTRVRKMLSTDDCWKLVVNPENWQEVAGRWSGDFEDKVESFWLTKNKSKAANAVEQFETAVKARRVSWIDPDLSRHILNTHTLETPQGILIRQETPSSKRYITAAQAAVLALEAAKLSIEEGALSEEPTYELYSF
jgi:hypothetical protein